MKDPRRLVLMALLLIGLCGYAAVGVVVGRAGLVSERVFGEARPDAVGQLRAYVEIIAIDAINDSLRLRVSFSANAALRGAQGAGSPDRDLRVRLGNADTEQVLSFRRQETMTAATIDVDLGEGTVAAFPLDRFRSDLHIAASDGDGATLPTIVTSWDGLAGWSPAVTLASSDAPGDVHLRFDLRRSLPVRLLVLAIYGEMILIGLAALTIGCRIFLGFRPPESTMTGALTGMVFSLPALRYALPGSIPLGVRADLLVFFWAELAVALGFVLFFATWARVRIKT